MTRHVDKLDAVDGDRPPLQSPILATTRKTIAAHELRRLSDRLLLDEYSRVPSQGVAGEIRRCYLAGKSRTNARGSGTRGPYPGHDRLGGEGADSRGRPREGDVQEWIQGRRAFVQIA